MVKTAYGFCEDVDTSSASRWVQPSVYSHARGAYTYKSSSYTGGNDNCWWWLRSPGYFPNCAASVDDYGDVFEVGDDVDDSTGAVVPALRLHVPSDN